MVKFFEITDPVSGYIHVWGTEMQSEAEIREEWHKSLAPDHAEKVEPRKIKIRVIARHRLGTPEHEEMIRHPERGLIYPGQEED